MKDKLDKYTFIIIGLFLTLNTILALFAFADLSWAVFNNALTPIVTLFTGLVIFLTLRENQKATKEMSKGNELTKSQRLYEYHLEDIKTFIDRQVFNDDVNPEYQKKVMKLKESGDEYYDELLHSTPKTWYNAVSNIMFKLKREHIYDELHRAYEEQNLSYSKFFSFDYSDLFTYVDHSVNETGIYFRRLNRKLHDLIFEKNDLMEYDKKRLIQRILYDTGYKNFFTNIETKYVVENGFAKLSPYIDKYNIEIVAYKVIFKDKLTFDEKFHTRSFVRWEAFLKIMEEYHELKPHIDMI